MWLYWLSSWAKVLVRLDLPGIGNHCRALHGLWNDLDPGRFGFNKGWRGCGIGHPFLTICNSEGCRAPNSGLKFDKYQVTEEIFSVLLGSNCIGSF